MRFSAGKKKYVTMYVSPKGYDTFLHYPHYSIVGYCNNREMEMYFCKINSDMKGHFIYSPIYAMQFAELKDAQAVINHYKLERCYVQPMLSCENHNVFGRDIQI